jgi:hypothetical protein
MHAASQAKPYNARKKILHFLQCEKKRGEMRAADALDPPLWSTFLTNSLAFSRSLMVLSTENHETHTDKRHILVRSLENREGKKHGDKNKMYTCTRPSGGSQGDDCLERTHSKYREHILGPSSGSQGDDCLERTHSKYREHILGPSGGSQGDDCTCRRLLFYLLPL